MQVELNPMCARSSLVPVCADLGITLEAAPTPTPNTHNPPSAVARTKHAGCAGVRPAGARRTRARPGRAEPRARARVLDRAALPRVVAAQGVYCSPTRAPTRILTPRRPACASPRRRLTAAALAAAGLRVPTPLHAPGASPREPAYEPYPQRQHPTPRQPLKTHCTLAPTVRTGALEVQLSADDMAALDSLGTGT